MALVVVKLSLYMSVSSCRASRGRHFFRPYLFSGPRNRFRPRSARPRNAAAGLHLATSGRDRAAAPPPPRRRRQARSRARCIASIRRKRRASNSSLVFSIAGDGARMCAAAGRHGRAAGANNVTRAARVITRPIQRNENNTDAYGIQTILSIR